MPVPMVWIELLLASIEAVAFVPTFQAFGVTSLAFFQSSFEIFPPRSGATVFRHMMSFTTKAIHAETFWGGHLRVHIRCGAPN